MENNTPVENQQIDISILIKDPRLVDKISAKINKYNFRPALGNGRRYKRTPEDHIIEAGNFNAMWFIDEFLKTISKTSTLSKAIRDCVGVYVVTSMQELYFDIVKESKKAEETKNGNKKKSRGKSTNL